MTPLHLFVCGSVVRFLQTCSVPLWVGRNLWGHLAKHRAFPDRLELEYKFLHSHIWFVKCCKASVSKKGTPWGLLQRRVRPLLFDNFNYWKNIGEISDQKGLWAESTMKINSMPQGSLSVTRKRHLSEKTLALEPRLRSLAIWCPSTIEQCKKWSLFPQSLNLVWACDLFEPIKCSRSDWVPFLSHKRLDMLLRSLLESCQPYVNKVSLWEDERPREESPVIPAEVNPKPAEAKHVREPSSDHQEAYPTHSCTQTPGGAKWSQLSHRQGSSSKCPLFEATTLR